MTDSVKGKIKSGIIWNSIEKLSVQGVTFVMGVVLARLLDPTDYGLIGMLGIFMALSTTLVDSGLSNALVQKHDCTDKDFSTVFVVNLVMSLFIYALLFICAPYIADFYNEPLLCNLTRVLALQFVLTAVNIVHRAKLTAFADFKALAKINVSCSLISGATGVVLAYLGLGVWALVAQSLTSVFVAIFLFPIYSHWKPSIVFYKESFTPLFRYGWKLVVTGLYSTIINNIYTIVIGKYYSSRDLGFYSKGYAAPNTFSNIIYSVIGGVSFPIMSSIKDNKEQMLHLYKKSLFSTALVVFPFMTLIASLSPPLVSILYTDKWLPCVFIMQMFCLARMFTPLSAINISILNASGRSDLFMKMDLSKFPLLLLTMLITLPLGINAMAIGSMVNTFLCFFINCYFPGKLYKYNAWQQLKDWRYIILSVIIMNAFVYILMQIVLNPWLQVAIGGVLGLVVYGICCILFNIVDKETFVSKVHMKNKN
ncbi:MAG: lipopolysaccharide biosynthesis protein [Paludibacteraceae bacterium]|nr:lipopolysaccharide biosynthesis protein [Paludibacteraceae bacterium]